MSEIDLGPLTKENIDQQFCSDWLKAEIKKLFDTLEGLESESQEQARLLGISGSKELKLLAEIEELKKKLDITIKALEVAMRALDDLAEWESGPVHREDGKVNRSHDEPHAAGISRKAIATIEEILK